MILYSSCPGCRKQVRVAAGHASVCGDGCNTPSSAVEQLVAGYVAAAETDAPALELDQLAEALDEADREPPCSLGVAAAAYARAGLPCFPLSTRGKLPAVSRQRGGKGVLDATTDVDRIERWWKRNPTNNIGLATGFKFDVVDVDFDKGAAAYWPNVRDVDSFEVDALVSTPHGLHAYVLPTGESNTANAKTGIDFRGKGGYVVAPPSVVECDRGHRSKRACSIGIYRWWSKPSPRILE